MFNAIFVLFGVFANVWVVSNVPLHVTNQAVGVQNPLVVTQDKPMAVQVQPLNTPDYHLHVVNAQPNVTLRVR